MAALQQRVTRNEQSIDEINDFLRLEVTPRVQETHDTVETHTRQIRNMNATIIQLQNDFQALLRLVQAVRRHR
jgi:hypothetical protein